MDTKPCFCDSWNNQFIRPSFGTVMSIASLVRTGGHVVENKILRMGLSWSTWIVIIIIYDPPPHSLFSLPSLMWQVIGNVATAHSSLSTATNVSQSSPCYTYSVKKINPKRKSDFGIVQMKAKQRFACIGDLRQQLLMEHKEKISNLIECLRYIEPGHGLMAKMDVLRWWLGADVFCA